ncbi:hypothetical protein HCU01_17550 [Halomonas cupida]|uniref:Uncharacterized protein n=1 Tax=Halomonas cupida TaxID=44933 RepID=A0ABQ0WDX0_9GAMM|nr:hypothetical protein HCU01_17550 [Halomonas cupida]
MFRCSICAEMLVNVGEIAGMIGVLIGKHSQESRPEIHWGSRNYEKTSG